MHIKDLTNRAGVTERQVRYLISEGFIPAPRGGRSNADYGEDHVEAIVRYSRLKSLGFPPAAIRLLLEATAGIPFPVAKGITLIIDTSRLGSGDAIEPILTRAREVLSSALERHPDGIPEGERND